MLKKSGLVYKKSQLFNYTEQNWSWIRSPLHWAVDVYLLKAFAASSLCISSASCDVQISLPVTDKTIKLWKVSERDKRPEGYNLKDEEGRLKDISTITSLQVRAHKHTHTEPCPCTPSFWSVTYSLYQADVQLPKPGVDGLCPHMIPDSRVL